MQRTKKLKSFFFLPGGKDIATTAQKGRRRRRRCIFKGFEQKEGFEGSVISRSAVGEIQAAVGMRGKKCNQSYLSIFCFCVGLFF